MKNNQYRLTSTGLEILNIRKHHESFHSNLFFGMRVELEDYWDDCKDEIELGGKASVVIDIDEGVFAFDFTPTEKSEEPYQQFFSNYHIWYHEEDYEYKDNAAKGMRAGFVMMDIIKSAEILGVDLEQEKII
jgi:hypothetical protein